MIFSEKSRKKNQLLRWPIKAKVKDKETNYVPRAWDFLLITLRTCKEKDENDFYQ